MTLVNALYSAITALQTTQSALQVTSNNIANVNTEGYTRKSAQQLTQVIDGQTFGVDLGQARRFVDASLLRQIRDQISVLTGNQAQNGFLERTQTLFGTPGSNTAISHDLAELGSALEALAAAPNGVVNQSEAVATAQRMTEKLNALNDQIQAMRRQADLEIAESVNKINDLLQDLDDLNGRIAEADALNRSADDLRDERDRLIGELAAEIDIQYFEQGNGTTVIATTAGRILLGSQATTLSHTAAAQIAAQNTHPGSIDGIDLGGSGVDITDEISGGRLHGLITIRDDTLVDLQAEFDRLTEVLRDQINAAHNDGTAFPPPSQLTGSRSVAAADAPPMSGTFRVAVLDNAGVVVENLDINLGGIANIGALVTAINGMTNATASINADGQVVIAATGGNAIAVNEMDGQVTTGTATRGMAHFLGLNNLLDSGTDYDVALSDRVTSDTAALGAAGTLGFSIGGATTNVAYGAGDSLTDIAASINAAVGGANITASVVSEANGYRLELIDADGDNFFLSDSGGLTGQINLRPGQAGTAGRLEVDPDLLATPSLVAYAELSPAAGLAVGDIALAAGDSTAARALADVFTTDQTFAAAGGLAGSVTTLSDFATSIISLNAANANAVAGDVASGESLEIALETQFGSLSGVNLDEELSQLVILQNAYAASARVTTTVSQLFDELLQIAR